MSDAFLEAVVIGRRMVTPGMVRVTLGGEAVARFRSTGIGDEYVRLFFPDPGTGELVLPVIDAAGNWTWPTGRKSHCVCYTIRAVRDGEIDVDFAVHEHGRASEWALAAEPGDRITLRRPYGIYDAPPDADWHLFVADATGLPALSRLVEGLAAGVEARAIIEVADASHEQRFDTRASLRTAWLHGTGNALAPSGIAEAVRAVEIPTGHKPYVWVAGEVKATRAVRRYLRHELGWEAARYSVTGYWTQRREAWDAGWAALDPAIRQELDELWASHRDREEVADEVEATLERFGL